MIISFLFLGLLTWTKPIVALLCHICLALTWGSSKELLLLFVPSVFSKSIATSCRACAKSPFTPHAINWKIISFGNFIYIQCSLILSWSTRADDIYNLDIPERYSFPQ